MMVRSKASVTSLGGYHTTEGKVPSVTVQLLHHAFSDDTTTQNSRTSLHLKSREIECSNISEKTSLKKFACEIFMKVSQEKIEATILESIDLRQVVPSSKD